MCNKVQWEVCLWTKATHPSSWLARGIWESLERFLAYSSSIFILRGKWKVSLPQSLYANWLFPCAFSVLCNTVMYMNEHKKKRKRVVWMTNCLHSFPGTPRMKCNREENTADCWRKKKKKPDTFLVWTQPSLSASVFLLAVCAAKPQILWDSQCPGCPSYRSAR